MGYQRYISGTYSRLQPTGQQSLCPLAQCTCPLSHVSFTAVENIPSLAVIRHLGSLDNIIKVLLLLHKLDSIPKQLGTHLDGQLLD